MPVADSLAGKHLLLTGATGFIGEALLERCLSQLPDTRVTVLIRPRYGADARARLAHLLTKPAFAGLTAAQRAGAAPLDGDLAEAAPELPGDLDVVVHCAGDVSFDPAIDDGFATNLDGTRHLLQAARVLPGYPHFVHVSTAYVAGLRRGRVYEQALVRRADWRQERDAAFRVRELVEAKSRLPERLATFRRRAAGAYGRAGPTTTAEQAEAYRIAWVREEMVAAGRERARTLGWTDCYTFTKAMTEAMVEDEGADLPLSIVRPSIVESALAIPYPGWIEGFKMAEPLILAFGRGELPDFPAVPDGVIDIVPVDFVAAAVLSVAARPPERGRATYFHVSSGARNPLRFQGLYDHVREYFSAHPLEQRGRGAIAVPHWRFPGADRVELALRRRERLHRLTERLVEQLPRSGRTRESMRTLDRARARLDFLRRYSDLYRPYVEAEVLFDDTNTARLLAAQERVDREAFPFDVAALDWRAYLQQGHFPSVTAPLRAARTASPARPASTALPQRHDLVAVFDLEGTLLRGNVVAGYLLLRLADAGPGVAAGRALATTAARSPRYLLDERRDRATMLRSVYRAYDGADRVALDRLVDEVLTDRLLGLLYPAAVRRVRAHRAAGHHVVLVTGAIAPLTRPFAPLFDEVVAAELAVDDDGRCTGHLQQPPVVGEARGAWLGHLARGRAADLSASYAYADSISDLALLDRVGNPTVVNPDHELAREARRRRWPVEHWAAP